MHRDIHRASQQASPPLPILVGQPSRGLTNNLAFYGLEIIPDGVAERARDIAYASHTNAGPQQGTISSMYWYSPLIVSGGSTLHVSALSAGPLRYLSLVDLLPKNFQNYADEFYHSLQQEPVLDGFNHPAEYILENTFATHVGEAEKWIFKQVTSSSSHPSRAADILRLLCRFRPSTPEWRRKIVDAALKSGSVEVRDAAIQAIETWTEPELVDILEAHSEPIAWLSDYAAKVIRDLNE